MAQTHGKPHDGTPSQLLEHCCNRASWSCTHPATLDLKISVGSPEAMTISRKLRFSARSPWSVHEPAGVVSRSGKQV